jgi:uncharacterized protein YecE (DUF72 family)
VSGGIIRIGISGWIFGPWRGVFYPKGLKREDELAFATRQFRTIEIASTFHGLLSPATFGMWTEQVPAELVFTVKGPREITHVRRLHDPEVPLANFIASGLLRLGPHLGPVVWQLPANLAFDPQRVGRFLRLLPRDTDAAIRIGRKHDSRLRAPPWLEASPPRPLRHALEVRHDSFRSPVFAGMLRDFNAALVFADDGETPPAMDVTADFVYCRLLRTDLHPEGGYNGDTLGEWANRARQWAAGGEPPNAVRIGPRAPERKRDVYVIVDNERKLRAPADAMELFRRLKS